ncbi:MAG: signal recognition particle protein Srp19, partial [Thermoplasmata archaeon]
AAEHLMTGRFSLRDMRTQLSSLGEMGTFSKLFSFLPGLGAAKVTDQQLDETQVRMRRYRAVLDSMNSAELDDAHLIKADRIRRIARGSGARPQDVRALLKHFDQTRKAAHGIVSNRRFRRQLERQMTQGGPPAP